MSRLRAAVASGRPILAAGASAGLIAKCAEAGGADLIVVYSTGKSRLMGLPTTPLGDSNATTLEMFDEIDNVVEETPIIGGVEASDPRFLDLRKLLRRFDRAGYAGVINFPTVGVTPARARDRENVGLGYSRDVAMVAAAPAFDLFTLAYVFDPEQAVSMASAGADCIVAHVGWTAGGLVGAGSAAAGVDAAHERIEQICAAARGERPDVICLAHGGPIATPADTESLYRATTVDGFVGASSVERIPVEEAVTRTVQAFKSVPLRAST